MKKIKVFLSVVALFMTTLSFAQKITVSGSVKDASTGESVPYAAVQVQGTVTGTTTDANGIYSISVAPQSTLVFSAIGYVDKVVAVNGKGSIDVVLDPDAELLEGTVVVGYGSAKKVGSIVGSVSTVSSDVLKNTPSTSPLDNLQGQVAGLAVYTTGGVAGDNSISMQLHGVGSISSSSAPLYVIDGVPSSSRTIMAMNPNDILSISVLKDASSTSIYGSRAANGVVFVTTKSGQYNTNAKVTVRGQYGTSTLANKGIYESVMSGDELKDFWIRAGLYSPAQIKAVYDDKGYNANTKWYTIMQRMNTPQYQSDVTIEGGGQKVAYMISASQFHQEGTTIGNYFDRYTVRSNVQGHPKNWLKVGLNVNLSADETQRNDNWSYSGDLGANYLSGGLSFILNPLYPVRDENGKLFEPKFPNGTSNPYVYMETYPDITKRYGLNGSAYVEIEPFKNLKFRSQIGSDTMFYFSNAMSIPSSALRSGTGAKSKSAQMTSNNTITNTLEYSVDIEGDHTFSVLLGQEGISNWYDYFSASSSGQTEDRLLRLNDGTASSRGVSEESSSSKFLSYFGHADYSYQGKYNLDFTLRNDASSRFGKDVRNAKFWSVGARWNARKENFVKNSSWLDDFSAKISYGTQGNAAIGDYRHLALIGTTAQYAEGTSWYIAQPSNRDLTWEKQGLFTVGFNARLFKLIDFEIEWYNRNTTSMLMAVPYPYTAGISEMTANIGGLSNSGIDISLGLDLYKGKDSYLRFNTTFNYNKEEVKELFDAAWDEDLNRYRWERLSYGYALVQGQPIMYYAPIFAGIDPADGAPTWYVPSDDPDVTTMDPANVTKKFDEDALTQNTGKKMHAPIHGGFSLEGGWKFLSFRADFSYRLGATLLNNDAYFYGNPVNFLGYNTYKGCSDFWTPTNTDAKWPDWSKGYSMQFDTHLYENANFLRLKSLQVGINVPNKYIGGKVFDSIKITLTGRNLLTFTKYTGIDPEVDNNLTMGLPGNTKQFLAGIELGF